VALLGCVGLALGLRAVEGGMLTGSTHGLYCSCTASIMLCCPLLAQRSLPAPLCLLACIDSLCVHEVLPFTTVSLMFSGGAAAEPGCTTGLGYAGHPWRCRQAGSWGRSHACHGALSVCC
jgi:hypothetical protein